MTKEELEQKVAIFVNESPMNYVSEQEALSPDCVGLKMYEPPVWGYGSAADELFRAFQKKEAVGPQFLLPEQWMEDARSVISFFLPFTEQVKKSNRKSKEEPSKEWLHARIEGQKFVLEVSRYIKLLLEEEGMLCVIPAEDSRFHSVTKSAQKQEELWEGCSYTSNWSERHVAYLCGLGTFGLSKGLITEKGMAGRLGSLIVSGRFEPRVRSYTGIYDYCTSCGACVRRCPAEAISLETGKNHEKCEAFLSKTKEAYRTHMGCGKCQTKVPCESKIPLLKITKNI